MGSKEEWDALARSTAAAYSWFARCMSSSSVARRAAWVGHPHRGGNKNQAEVFFKEECARTWTSSGSGVGRDWIRYSICLAFTMRSSTSSFWFAFFAPVCVRERGEGVVELTLEDIGRVDLVRVTLFRDGDLLRDLDKVGAGG